MTAHLHFPPLRSPQQLDRANARLARLVMARVCGLGAWTPVMRGEWLGACVAILDEHPKRMDNGKTSQQRAETALHFALQRGVMREEASGLLAYVRAEDRP